MDALLACQNAGVQIVFINAPTTGLYVYDAIKNQHAIASVYNANKKKGVNLTAIYDPAVNCPEFEDYEKNFIVRVGNIVTIEAESLVIFKKDQNFLDMEE